jgi:glutaredoxin 3
MLLDEKQLDYDEIDIEARPDARAEMQAQGAGHSVPQVFIDDRPIGGCDELYTLDASGRLDKIISGAA